MILEKTSELRLRDVPETISEYYASVQFQQDYIRIHHLYRGAMQQAAAQLDILDDEFTSVYHHSPIHHVECRVKSMDSLIEKIQRKGMAVNMDSVHKIHDIAGIRVVCNYIHDVYYLRRLLTCDQGFRLIRQSDYIKNPKPNGYRSLHLIVSVPFMISEGKIELPVEIQLRTIAMDMWASLEHELRYKANHHFTEADLQELAHCAEQLAQVDQTMQRLFLKDAINTKAE